MKKPKPSARLLLDRVWRARDAGLTALMILRARAFLAECPDNGPVWGTLGGLLTSVTRYEEAELALKKAIELTRPDELRLPYMEMGQLFKAAGDYQRAEAWYRLAVEIAPDNAGGHIHLGSTLAWQRRLDEAEAAYRRATQCESGCIEEAYLYLGYMLLARERFGEAAVCLEEALRRDPEYREAKRALRDVTACMREQKRSR